MKGAPGPDGDGRAVEVVVTVAPSSGAAAAVRLPDPLRSYAVLIGSSRYGSAGLSDLPAVAGNLAGLPSSFAILWLDPVSLDVQSPKT